MHIPAAASPLDTSSGIFGDESVKYRAFAAIRWINRIPSIHPIRTASFSISWGDFANRPAPCFAVKSSNATRICC